MLLLVSTLIMHANEYKGSKVYLDSVYIYANYTYTDTLAARGMKQRLEAEMMNDNYTYALSISQLYEALILEAKGEIPKARLQYEHAIKSIGQDYEKSEDVLNILFSVYLYYSNMEMLEYHYIESLRLLYDLELILKKIKPEWLVEVYNNLASVYSELKEDFLFRKYLNKASEIVRESAPLETYLTVRLNEASVLYMSNDYQLSLNQLNNFRDSIYSPENTYIDLEEMYWCLYALNCYELNMLDEARNALRKFYTIETKDAYYRVKALMLEMTMDSNEGKTNDIQSKVNECYTILQSYDNPHLMKDFYRIMQNVYPTNKDSVLKYYQMYMIYEDSVRHLSHSGIMLDMENQQALYDLDAEYQAISDELDYQVQANKAKTVVIVLVVLILFLTMIVVYLIWKRNERLRIQIKNLVESNREIYKRKQKNVENAKAPKAGVDSIVNTKALIQGWEQLMTKQKRYTDLQITLGQVAKELNTNTSYLSALINNNYGKNFNKLINEYRLKEALRLFHADDMQKYTIEHVANQSGFRSMSSFYSVFKRGTGVTPKQYLNELKKQLINESH